MGNEQGTNSRPNSGAFNSGTFSGMQSGTNSGTINSGTVNSGTNSGTNNWQSSVDNHAPWSFHNDQSQRNSGSWKNNQQGAPTNSSVNM